MAESVTNQFSAKLGNRPVWVLNRFHLPWKEQFRGNEVEIPPNEEKVVKMPYLAARRFLGQTTALGEQRPDGQWITQPKALYIQELTKEELDPKETVQLAKELHEQEQRAELTCTLCGTQAMNEKGLKVHMSKMHPDAIPVDNEE